MSRKELLPIPELTESRRSYDRNAYRNYNLRQQSPRFDPRAKPAASPVGDMVSSASNPRHWMYLFENLQISVMRIFHLAQNDRSATECKEVIFLLEKYLRSFHTLYESFHSKHRCENVPSIGRNKILQPVIPDLNELYDKRYRSKELVRGRTERRERKHEDDVEVNYGDDEYSKQKHAMILRNRKQEEDVLVHRNHDQYIEKRTPREKLRRCEQSEETNSTGEDYEQFEGQQAQEMVNDMNKEQQRREQQHHERVRKEHARCERSQSPKNSKMYEKLFGDSRQSKDVQREIEKFNQTMHQQPRNDELDEEGTDFSDHYKQHRTKHTINSKKQILDKIAAHSENVFKYLEDDQEEDKDLEKYHELKEDETLTDISEIGQNDDPFSENTASHRKKSIDKQSHSHRSSSPRKVSIKNPEVTGCEHLIKRDDQWEMTKPKLSNSSKKKETYPIPNDDFITTDYLEPTCI